MQALIRSEVRSAGPPRVRAAAASGLCDRLRHRGAEPDDILRRVRLQTQDLEQPLSWLSLADYCDLLEEASSYCGSPAFGLELGLARSTDLLGDLGGFATCAPTLHTALAAITRHFASLQEQTAVTLELQDDRVSLTYQIRDGRIRQRRQDSELTLGVLIGCIRLSLGERWRPEAVHFEHGKPDGSDAYDALPGTRVFFQKPRNAIVFKARDISVSTRAPSPLRFAEIERRIIRRPSEGNDMDLVGAVLQHIRDALARGEPGADRVARRLGLSTPALYRRLKACGVEFSALQRDVRRELALSQVSQLHVPLTEIAFALGYSELSAFSRAFRSWTGVSPNQYRRGRG